MENFQQTGGFDGNYTKTLNLNSKTLQISQEKLPITIQMEFDRYIAPNKEIIWSFFLKANKANSILAAIFCSERPLTVDDFS